MEKKDVVFFSDSEQILDILLNSNEIVRIVKYLPSVYINLNPFLMDMDHNRSKIKISFITRKNMFKATEVLRRAKEDEIHFVFCDSLPLFGNKAPCGKKKKAIARHDPTDKGADTFMVINFKEITADIIIQQIEILWQKYPGHSCYRCGPICAC